MVTVAAAAVKLCRARFADGAAARGRIRGPRQTSQKTPARGGLHGLGWTMGPGKGQTSAFCDVRMLRLAAARSRAIAAPLLRGQTRNLGAPVSADFDKNLGRTPERTAELERLAEEHNGFMFGEIVRAYPFYFAANALARVAPRFFGRRRRSPPVPRLSPFSPRQPGEKREWEDWEYSYVPLMTSAFIIYGVAFAYRCVCPPKE